MNNDEVGELIARRYRVLETIGSGGLGTVYKALDTRFNRVVALKVLDRTSGVASTQPLRLEAAALARLTHPNIVQVYEIGETRDLLYLVEDYIEGPTLFQLIVDSKPLDWIYTTELIRQVGTALGHAHRHGIIHRDVKPTNIIISNEGRVLLLDFGLAIEPGAATLTQAGTVMGTSAYMSPEQLLGKPVDARSDLFSLGVVFYELLTGRRPFSADTAFESIRNVIEKVPLPPTDIEPTIPAALDGIVLKSLAKAPDERFQSVNEFLNALESVRIPARPASNIGPINASNALPASGPTVNISSTFPPMASVEKPPTSTPAFRTSKLGWLAGTLAVILLGGYAVALRSIGIAVSTIVLCGIVIWVVLRSNWLKTIKIATRATSHSDLAMPPGSRPDQPVDAGELDTVEMPPYTPSQPALQQKMTVGGDLLERYKQLAQSQYSIDIPLEMRQRIEEFDTIWNQLMNSTGHNH